MENFKAILPALFGLGVIIASVFFPGLDSKDRLHLFEIGCLLAWIGIRLLDD